MPPVVAARPHRQQVTVASRARASTLASVGLSRYPTAGMAVDTLWIVLWTRRRRPREVGRPVHFRLLPHA